MMKMPDYEELGLGPMTLAHRCLRALVRTDVFVEALTTDTNLTRHFTNPAAVIGEKRQIYAMNSAFSETIRSHVKYMPCVGEPLSLVQSLCQRIDTMQKRPVTSSSTEVSFDDSAVLQIVPIDAAMSRYLWLIFPRQGPEVSLSAFREKFNLTETETEILRHLSEGEAPREIAVNTERSYGTVRWHVQNILEKTGSESQQKLLSKLYQERSL